MAGEEENSPPAQAPGQVMGLPQALGFTFRSGLFLCPHISSHVASACTCLLQASSSPGTGHLMSLLTTEGDLIIRGLFELLENSSSHLCATVSLSFRQRQWLNARGLVVLQTVLYLLVSPWKHLPEAFNLTLSPLSHPRGSLQLSHGWTPSL